MAASLPEEKIHPVDSLIGTVVDRYLIKKKLGEGIGGVLYEAVHPALGKRAVVKFMKRDPGQQEEDQIERFFAEGRAAAQVDHANVVSVFNFGRLSEGRLYLMMEYLQGETLEDFLRKQGPLEISVLRSLAGQLLAGLAACHLKGIMHRDIKPDNMLLLDRPGGYKQLKLIDFGIARSLGCDLGPAKTLPGSLMGTPLYMAPEQISAENKVIIDARADLYSFGIILYRMATGRLPFVDQDWRRVLFQHAYEAPPSPREIREEIPEDLEAFILCCLAKAPEDRPQSATDALQLLLPSPETTAESQKSQTFRTMYLVTGGVLLGTLLTWLGNVLS